MANTLQWKESDSNTSSTFNAASSSNPWFAATIGLAGIVAGFGIGTFIQKGNVSFGTIPQQVAQAPTVPTPAAPTPTPAAGPLQPIDPKVDHIRGDITKAQVAVIEYSDYECPFCMRVEPTLEQITKEYGEKVVVVYRHFPLSFHANAQKEAEASDCADDQGKFWEYHDGIFKKTQGGGTGFPLENLVPMAKDLGLNEATFKNCLDTGKYTQHVKDEQAAGGIAGVNGTPGSFVVNLKTQKSQFISGAVPFASFKAAIDAAL